MPNIPQFFNSSLTYSGVDFNSLPINIANATLITVSVFSSVPCTMTLNWINNLEDGIIIQTVTQEVSADQSTKISIPIISNYIQFNIIDFMGSSPITLESFGIYY